MLIKDQFLNVNKRSEYLFTMKKIHEFKKLILPLRFIANALSFRNLPEAMYIHSSYAAKEINI